MNLTHYREDMNGPRELIDRDGHDQRLKDAADDAWEREPLRVREWLLEVREAQLDAFPQLVILMTQGEGARADASLIAEALKDEFIEYAIECDWLQRRVS